MNIPLTEAKAKLTELVRRAEAGEEVVLTRHGRRVVKLVPERTEADRERAREASRRLDALRAEIKQPLTVEEIIALKNEGRR